MREIRGSVAVVTGAASGIGRALAQELAARGARLALADLDSSGLEQTAKLVGNAEVRTYKLDVSDADAVEAFARQVQQDFGRASLLINNAGVAMHGTFAELSLADIEWLMKINFWGVVYGCKFFLPMLQREPDAHVVNISSVFGLIGFPGQTAYCASKFAVRGLTETLRHELSETNVHVTCVHPGGIRTAIARNARTGAAANGANAADLVQRFEKLTPTMPATAAQVIIQGVLRNKPRVLIGADARRIDRLQRLMPTKATELVVKSMEKQAPPAEEPAPVTAAARK